MARPDETLTPGDLELLFVRKLTALDATPYQPPGLAPGSRYAWGELATAYTTGVEGQAVEHLGFVVEVDRMQGDGKRARHDRESVVSTVVVRYLYLLAAAAEASDARRAKRAGVDIIRTMTRRRDPDLAPVLSVTFQEARWQRQPESALMEGAITFKVLHDLDTSTP